MAYIFLVVPWIFDNEIVAKDVANYLFSWIIQAYVC